MRSVVPYVAVVALVLPACSESPTEPAAPSPLAIAVEPLGGSPAGTVQVLTDVCGCVDGDLSVRTDGALQGMVPCSGLRDVFVVPGAHRLVLQGRAAAASGAFDAPAGAGVRVVVTCARTR